MDNNSKAPEGPGSVGEMLPCHFVFSGFWNGRPADLWSSPGCPLWHFERDGVIAMYMTLASFEINELSEEGKGMYIYTGVQQCEDTSPLELSERLSAYSISL